MMPTKLQTISKLLSACVVASALALGACTDAQMEAALPKGTADAPVSPRLVAVMQKKGMSRESPILARVFKEENVVEIWKQKTNGRYDLLASYQICKMSGKLGPKFIEGDRQSPEGFYTVRPGQMNPNSNYHLAFNIGYPNAYDRVHGRTGSNLMVHGACSSSGCFSMNDGQMTEIYAVARDSFKGGQTDFQIQSFPFRMTAANMARYKDDPNYAFWRNIKEGYDYFEVTKTPPKVDVCEKRYVFNADSTGGPLSPSGKCPATASSDGMKMAFQSYQSGYDAAFTSALGSGRVPAPKPSIAGIEEAKVVSDWTKRRARGERVPIEPPVLGSDGAVVQTTSRMGRIDSEAGRRMAARDAQIEAKKKADAEKAEAKAAAAIPAETTAVPVSNPQRPMATADVADAADPAADSATTPAPSTGASGLLSRVGKRFTSMFGG